MRRRSMVALLAALIVMTMALGATAASAGEVTGKGEATAAPANANSICAFSGQNDGFHDPELADSPEDALTRVQSWGQISKADRDFLKSIGVHPGTECRGGSNSPH